MKEWQESRDTGFKGYMSPQFIYNHRVYWNNGKQNGQGALEFASNWVAEGEFLNDKLHGNILVTSPDGVIDELYYQYGSLVEAGDLIFEDPF